MEKQKFNLTNAVIAFLIVILFIATLFSILQKPGQRAATRVVVPVPVQQDAPPDAGNSRQGRGGGPADAGNPQQGRGGGGPPDAGNPQQGRGGGGPADTGNPQQGRGGGPADVGNPQQGRGDGGPDTGNPQQGRGGGGPPDAGNPQQGRGGGAVRNVPAVRVKPVERGDISNSILINGDVLAAREVSIFPVVAGKIVELRLRVGDRVEEGQVVAVIDPSRPGEVYSGSPVRSTIKGTVLQAPYSIGDTVSQQSAVYVVGDLSTLVVETFVPERFSSNIRTGQTAGFFFDSMPGESFAGVVSEVSPVLDPASRTLRIRLRFERNDPRIRPGMFATVRLVTASRRNVMVIPRAAIINTYNTWIVFIVNPENAAERREISLGLESETMVEVLGGLLIGDLVIISGQNFLSNGEPVRVLDENPNQ